MAAAFIRKTELSVFPISPCMGTVLLAQLQPEQHFIWKKVLPSCSTPR